ncbi:MAG: hypothetical protein JSS11_09000 [Verrucomicrobia bacterium]|nr:hypothetical protein [Verrucomicrobiota bacterium]
MKNEIELGVSVGTAFGRFAQKYLRAPLIVLGVAGMGAALAGWFGFVIGIIAGVGVLVWLQRRQAAQPTQNNELLAGMPTVAGIASFASLLGTALRDMDDVAPIGGGTIIGTGARTWHDGEGKRVQLGTDGRLYYNGRFIGHRDASGRIMDGSGTFIGTLKDSGAMHAPNGDYKGRMFS